MLHTPTHFSCFPLKILLLDETLTLTIILLSQFGLYRSTMAYPLFKTHPKVILNLTCYILPTHFSHFLLKTLLLELQLGLYHSTILIHVHQSTVFPTAIMPMLFTLMTGIQDSIAVNYVNSYDTQPTLYITLYLSGKKYQILICIIINYNRSYDL